MSEAPSLLLIEDDDVAAEAVERGLARAGVTLPLVWVENGFDALRVLRGEHESKRIRGPLMVLLDLNMPRMNGFEFLEEVRRDPKLAALVVFVLTTSDAESDRARAYGLNIAGYIVKAAAGPMFAHVAKLIAQYTSIVTLPHLPG